MSQNLIFTMSLSGSIVFILYIFTYPLAKRYFSLKWRYRVLKIAIIFYLIPIPMCKYLIMNVIYRFLPQLWEKMSHIFVTMDRKYLIIISQDFVKFSSKAKYMLMVIFFIEIVSFTIIRKQIVQYWKWKKVQFIGSEKPTNWEQELFSKMKKEIGIKKDEELICSEYCKSPMTSGILSSILIFPKWRDEMDTDKYRYMLKHELIHIKHHDLLIKYMGLLLMAVHWYNPFVYIMFHEISVISEMYCDSIVISGKGEKERRNYGNLILKLAVQNKYTNKGQFFVGMANSRNKWIYKRRFLEMKRDKKYNVVLPVIITTFICMISGITAFAYDSPKTILNDIGYNFDADIDFTIEIIGEDCIDLPSDYFFIDNSGKIYDIASLNKTNKSICFHDFSLSGTLNTHKKDGKGGCVVNRYEALLCAICSDAKLGELKSTITYNPCPH